MKAGILALTLFLGFGAAQADPPPGAEQQPNASFVYGIWPAQSVCTRENAKAVAMRDLLRNLPQYRDQCVSTVAFLKDRALFLTRRETEVRYPSSSAATAGRRIGLYASEQIMSEIWSSNGKRVRIVGLVWDCEMLHGPDVVMVMGYCHYTDGPIIGAASVTVVR